MQWPTAYIVLPPRLRKRILHFSQLGYSHELHATPLHIALGHNCCVRRDTFLHCPLAHKGQVGFASTDCSVQAPPAPFLNSISLCKKNSSAMPIAAWTNSGMCIMARDRVPAKARDRVPAKARDSVPDLCSGVTYAAVLEAWIVRLA